MKFMQLAYHDGGDVFSNPDDVRPVHNPEYIGNVVHPSGVSKQIYSYFDAEMQTGRKRWARLEIHIDDYSLFFWLPAELDHYCEVFARKPFPTALQLAKRGGEESLLNQHWLSRLPKRVKSPGYRGKFLKFVASEPLELRKFREFYGPDR